MDYDYGVRQRGFRGNVSAKAAEYPHRHPCGKVMDRRGYILSLREAPLAARDEVSQVAVAQSAIG